MTGVIRFEDRGPAERGLVEWDPIDPAAIESGTPVQRGHLYDEDETRGYSAGVWDCTAFVDKAGPYPVDEFMLVLEGAVVMKMPDGPDITISAGEAFVIPRGLSCQWTIPDYVRKVFMIVEGAEPEAGANASLGRITRPALHTPALNGADVVVERTQFLNSDGSMSVSVLDCGALRLPERRVSAHDLVHVLAGGLTLTVGGGATRFDPGETAYVRAGSAVGVETAEGTRLLRARHSPDCG